MLAQIGPSNKEKLGSGEYLFSSNLPGPDLAFGCVERNVMAITIWNDTESPILYQRGTNAGLVIPKDEAQISQTVNLNRYAAGLKTLKVTEMQYSHVCFCTLTRKRAKLVKILFINKHFESGFRNATALSSYKSTKGDQRKLIIRGDTIFVRNDLIKTVTLLDIQEAMANFNADKDSFLIILKGLGQMTLGQQEIVSFMSRFTTDLTIKYFYDGIHHSLCAEHKPHFLPAVTRCQILILAGKNKPEILGDFVTTYFINDIRIDIRFFEENNDSVLFLYLHYPEHLLKN